MKHLIKMTLVAFVSLSLFSACEKDPKPTPSRNGDDTEANALRNTTWAGTFSSSEMEDGVKIDMIVDMKVAFGDTTGTLTAQLKQILYNDLDVTGSIRHERPEFFEPQIAPFTYTYEHGAGTMTVTDTDEETGETDTETIHFTVKGDKMSFRFEGMLDITLTKQ